MMKINLSGKKAMVCAASQGLGLASAIELSRAGADVTIISRDEKRLKEALDQLICRKDQQHHFIVADFSKGQVAVENIIEKAKYVPDILVTNGGGPPSGSILDLSAEDFQKGFEAHFKVFHELARWALPEMKKKNYGRIINILSVSVVKPIRNLPVSNVIRAGISHWGKTLAMETGSSGITVNGVLPGYTATDRLKYLFEKNAGASGRTVEQVEGDIIEGIPAGRLGKPEELAYLVTFLASPMASYINGVDIPVDGGASI